MNYRGTVVRLSAVESDFSLHQSTQTGSGAHVTSCSIDIKITARGQMWSGGDITAHLYLVPRLKMRAAIQSCAA